MKLPGQVRPMRFSEDINITIKTATKQSKTISIQKNNTTEGLNYVGKDTKQTTEKAGKQ